MRPCTVRCPVPGFLKYSSSTVPLFGVCSSLNVDIQYWQRNLQMSARRRARLSKDYRKVHFEKYDSRVPLYKDRQMGICLDGDEKRSLVDRRVVMCDRA